MKVYEFNVIFEGTGNFKVEGTTENHAKAKLQKKVKKLIIQRCINYDKGYRGGRQRNI